MTETDKLLTRRELADELGVSVPTIDKWKADKGLPHIKNQFNGAIRFDPVEVRRWMESKLKRVR